MKEFQSFTEYLRMIIILRPTSASMHEEDNTTSVNHKFPLSSVGHVENQYNSLIQNFEFKITTAIPFFFHLSKVILFE